MSLSFSLHLNQAGSSLVVTVFLSIDAIHTGYVHTDFVPVQNAAPVPAVESPPSAVRSVFARCQTGVAVG